MIPAAWPQEGERVAVHSLKYGRTHTVQVMPRVDLGPTYPLAFSNGVWLYVLERQRRTVRGRQLVSGRRMSEAPEPSCGPCESYFKAR